MSVVGKIPAYIAQLKQQREIRVDETEWTPFFRAEFVAALAAEGLNDYKIYKSVYFEQPCYVVCLGADRIPTYPVIQTYRRHQGVWKIVPLMAALVVIAVTALLAQHNGWVMTVSFLFGIPMILGALVQYFKALSVTEKKQTGGEGFKTQLFVFISIFSFAVIVLREGIICLIMAAPIIVIGVWLGMLMMKALLHFFWQPTPKIYSLALLPLLLLLVVPEQPNIFYGDTQRELVINAPAAQVFAAINNIQDIQPDEIKNSVIFNMGFPKPVSGMTVAEHDGLVRHIHWQRGIYFQEKITASEPSHLLSWTYRFSPDSFPKGSLDDHVKMGGKYFDLLSTSYRLQAIDAQHTRLILSIDYRLSTEFNWYAKWWVSYVLNEFSDVVLSVYQKRLG